MRKTRSLKNKNRHLKEKVKPAKPSKPVFFVLKKISIMLAIFALVFGEIAELLPPMNESHQTAQAATAVNVTASTEAQLDSYLSSTTTSYNIQITANITLIAGVTVGNSQTLYGNGSAALDMASYAITTPAGASLTLGDNNSSDSLMIQNESGTMLAGSENLTLNNSTTINSTSTSNLISFNGGSFIGNGGTVTRNSTSLTAPNTFIYFANGTFSLYGGNYQDNNIVAPDNVGVALVNETVPIISGGVITGNVNNALGTISGGAFGALIGSETTPFSGYGFNIIGGSTISGITGGVFTGQASGALDNGSIGTLIKQIDGGVFYGQKNTTLNTNNATTLLEPTLKVPTQGTARFRSGVSGNSILNNAANFTLPTGYSISSTSTTSGVAPTSLGSLGFYYLTPSSEAVTFNWQLSSSAKAIQGSALFTNQSTSNTFTATGNYSYGSNLSTLANFGATGDTPNTYLMVPFNTGSPTYGTKGYYIQSNTSGTNTVSASYSSGTTAATTTPSTTVPASIPVSWTVGATTTANTCTVTGAPYLQAQNWTEVFTTIGGGTSPVLATNPFYVSKGLTGANVTYPTLPTIPTGYYTYDIKWTNSVNQYH